MKAIKTSFKGLFDKEETKVVDIYIPKIQRAYAQGREDTRTERTRKAFLLAIHEALIQEKGMTLDFIYGNINHKDGDEEKPGTLTPLDGQQRLTTLFLLHWYAAKKENISDEESEFLRNFSYQTRYSARDFCIKLIDFNPSLEKDLSEDITNQYWFPYDWEHDPTIASMLVMLDAIQHDFADIPDLWNKLELITFYFLSIDEMKQTDDIYIKMNSRGKPLTDFEHFKAELEKVAKEKYSEKEGNLMHKIDVEWTDMLWKYRRDENNPDDKNNDIIDDEFMRYFRFVCDILCYSSNGSPDWKMDELELLKKYFMGENAGVNFSKLEDYFDCWCNCEDIKGLFSKFLCKEHEQNKVMTRYEDYGFNLFESCLHEYGEMRTDRTRKFTLNQTILLYSFITYLLQKKTITEEDFYRRLRVIGNLIKNSSNDISDSENRSSGNRMPAILKQVDSIIVEGKVCDNERQPNFNDYQLEEEKEKLCYVDSHPDMAESLFALEDHALLTGQIGIVGLENIELFPTFAKLFECDWDLVDCALLSIGDYSQRDNKWRIQIGSANNAQAWKNLFHKSRSNGYERASKCLIDLLSLSDAPNNEFLRSIAQKYIDKCEQDSRFDWRYYYIKYSSFRAKRFGKYQCYVDKPYEMIAMYTAQNISENAYQVFLKEISARSGMGTIDRNKLGTRLIVGEKYVYCENSSIVINDSTDNNEKWFAIEQDENHIDKVNRIDFGAKCLKDYFLMEQQ